MQKDDRASEKMMCLNLIFYYPYSKENPDEAAEAGEATTVMENLESTTLTTLPTPKVPPPRPPRTRAPSIKKKSKPKASTVTSTQ